MTNTQLVSITSTRGRDMDFDTTVAQLTRHSLMWVGAHRWLRAADHLRFDTCCNSKRKRRFIVKLDFSDTYSIEVGRVVKGDWRIERQVSDIYADQLAEVVVRLFDEVYS